MVDMVMKAHAINIWATVLFDSENLPLDRGVWIIAEMANDRLVTINNVTGMYLHNFCRAFMILPDGFIIVE